MHPLLPVQNRLRRSSQEGAMRNMIENVFLPKTGKIIKNEKMTAIERFIQVELLDKKFAEGFDYRPGQFVEINVMGVGEAPVTICSMEGRRGCIDLCVRSVGRVTSAITQLSEGSLIGVRG